MRKTKTVTITAAGRDKGKTFILKEMPAAVAERWATRALLVLTRSGVDIGQADGAGWAGIAVLGFKALAQARFDEVQPLLDEMWQCVSIRPDPRHPEITRHLEWGDADGDGADIEEVATMLMLRAEVFSIHSGFSIPGANSTSSTSTLTPGDSRNTPTSAPSTGKPSRRSSPPGRLR